MSDYHTIGSEIADIIAKGSKALTSAQRTCLIGAIVVYLEEVSRRHHPAPAGVRFASLIELWRNQSKEFAGNGQFDSGYGWGHGKCADELEDAIKDNPQPGAVVGEGWMFERMDDTTIRVTKPGEGSCVVNINDHFINIPSYLLYCLASDTLAAKDTP